MKTIYIDEDFCCHVTNVNNALREIETNFFDFLCDECIECYRFIPSGESWTRSDGAVFQGEMITPRKDYSELDAIQRDYEHEKLVDAENALAILLGGEST